MASRNSTVVFPTIIHLVPSYCDHVLLLLITGSEPKCQILCLVTYDNVNHSIWLGGHFVYIRHVMKQRAQYLLMLYSLIGMSLC